MKVSRTVYNHLVEPEKYPSYMRRNAKAVTRPQLGNQIRFIALRWLDADEKGNLLNITEALDRYTKEFDLGDVTWPLYPNLFADNFNEFAEEAVKRGMYVMDFWGYVPGSNPSVGSIWGEFQLPEKLLKSLYETMGDHFLGFDNGEQDGRYIGGYAGMMCPAGSDRRALYDNFSAHFEKFDSHMDNRVLILSSLTFPHYFAKQGNAVFLGAETAQALPCANMWYSFIRGAGKQYGLLWFGNASIWNRWGWKDYDNEDAGPEYDEEVGGALTSNDLEHGPIYGTSLSLLKRLLYTEYMYNSDMLGFDASWFLEGENKLIDDKYVIKGSDAILSPIGIMQQSIKKFVDKYKSPGVMHSPVCIFLDFFNGFVPPRHLYTKEIYKVWGNNPYRAGDYQLHTLFGMLYPDYEDAGFFRDERGFLTATPYGDIADVILSDASSHVLDMYETVLAFGEGILSFEAYDKFIGFVKNGGHGVICCDKLAASDFSKYNADYLNELGLKKLLSKESFEGDVSYKGDACFEKEFDLYNVELSKNAEVIAKTEDGKPVIIRTKCGKGLVSVVCAELGMRLKDDDYSSANKENKKIAQPYEFLTCVEKYLGDVFDALNFIKLNNSALQYNVNIVSQNEFNVSVCNNGYAEETFDIICDTPIEVIERLIEDVNPDTPGFTPQDKYMPQDVKPSKTDGKYSIKPLDVKIFNIKNAENIVELKSEAVLPARNEKLYVALNTNTIKEFFEHNPSAVNYIKGVKVDAKYFDKMDIEYARKEAEFLKLQKVDVMVDFSSLINHYPDLSFIRNIEGRTEESIERMKNILKKASAYNCDKAIITLHRNAENMVTIETAYENMQKSLSEITSMAEKMGISIYLQNGRALETFGTFETSDKIYTFLAANSNLKYAHNMCHSLGAGENPGEVIEKVVPNGLCLSAPNKDMFGQFADTHSPVSLSNYLELAKQLVKQAKKYDFICLDAAYNDFDEIYSDMMSLLISNNKEVKGFDKE